MLDSKPLLFPTDFPEVRRRALDTLQVNLGYRCNQSCSHCHVDAGPKRTEQMAAETIDAVIDFLRRERTRTLDLTGGAPELNPHFRRLVVAATELGVQVTDRCNLTVLLEPGQERLAEFLAARHVKVIASLPCYLEENVDGQRGKGTFGGSIQGLRRLNALGYGDGRSGLSLELVYNPAGPTLPPPQSSLEADYKRVLRERYGVRFDRLLTLTNMPIRRFGSMLQSRGEFARYLDLLRGAHREENLDAVMCRSLVSVDWRGFVYDCDFNQMLGLPVGGGEGRRHVSTLRGADVTGSPIRVGGHCYGCTAGQGSSCGGALSGK
jgi:radical SAM/Cys-rich protein